MIILRIILKKKPESDLFESHIQRAVDALMCGAILEFRTPVLSTDDVHDIMNSDVYAPPSSGDRILTILSFAQPCIQLADKGKSTAHWVWTKKK